jgi:hypothetical protein
MGNSVASVSAGSKLEEALNLMIWALALLDESGSESFAAINLDLAINQLRDEINAPVAQSSPSELRG